MTFEPQMHVDSCKIIKIFSCYYGDKLMNITLIKIKFIFKVLPDNISVGLYNPMHTKIC